MRIENPGKRVSGTFTTTTSLSDRAREFARQLKIRVEENFLSRTTRGSSATSVVVRLFGDVLTRLEQGDGTPLHAPRVGVSRDAP
jgi:hypothetical protein